MPHLMGTSFLLTPMAGTTQGRILQVDPCCPQSYLLTWRPFYGSPRGGTSHTLLLPSPCYELSVSAGPTLSCQSLGVKGKDFKGSRERTPQTSPEIEGRWEEALLTWWMPPDLILQLTSEHLVSPMTTNATRRTQVPSFPFIAYMVIGHEALP